MSGVASSELVEQARAIEHPLSVPGVSGVWGLEVGGESKQVTQAQLDQIRAGFVKEMRRGLSRAKVTLESGTYGHRDMISIHEDQFVVSRISDTLGRTTLPELSIWDPGYEALWRAQAELKAARLTEAARDVEEAQTSSQRAMEQFVAYRQATIGGAAAAQTTLEWTRDISFAVAGIMATVATGGAGGLLIGTAISSTGTAAQQAMEVHLDMRREIDWRGIGVDAAIGIIVGAIGGKVAERLMKFPGWKQAGQEIVGRAAQNLLLGRGQAILTKTFKAIVDNLSGEHNAMTGEQLVAAIVHDLTDPKSLFMDMLNGEMAQRIAPAAAAKHEADLQLRAERKQLAASREAAPPVSEPGPTPVSEPVAEPTPITEPTAEPIPIAEPVAEPTPVTEPAPATEPIAATSEPPAPVAEPVPPGPEPLQGPTVAQNLPDIVVPDKDPFHGGRTLEEPSGIDLGERNYERPSPEAGAMEPQYEGTTPELDPQGSYEHPSPEAGAIEPQYEGTTPELDPHGTYEHPSPEAGAIEPQYEGTTPELDPQGTYERPPQDRLELWEPKKPKAGAKPKKAKPAPAPEPAAPAADPNLPEVYAPEKDPFGPQKLKTSSGLALDRKREGPKSAVRNEFGEASNEKGGSEHRQGEFFHEWNAAEIERGLRIDYDPIAGRPRKITYRVDPDIATAPGSEDRVFKQDPSTAGAQSRDAAYTNTDNQRGHGAQLEAFKGGSLAAQEAANQFTNVVPMKESLNRGTRDAEGVWHESEWRASEARTVTEYAKGRSVIVEIEPIYPDNPKRLSDGTPIPSAVRRRVLTLDGQVLEDQTHAN